MNIRDAIRLFGYHQRSNVKVRTVLLLFQPLPIGERAEADLISFLFINTGNDPIEYPSSCNEFFL